jgi:hypothetical protein
MDDSKKGPKKGLKINNDASIANALPTTPSKKEFEAEAKKVNETLNSYNDRALKLATDFRRIMNDATLPQNRNILSKELEREIITNLMQLAIDINTDQHEKDGMGSVGVEALIMNQLLTLRDRNNFLEFTLEQLTRKMKEMEVELLAMKKSVPVIDANKLGV